jgi:hypothetical protein
MLRRLKPVLTACSLCCGFCAALLGMTMLSAFGLATLRPGDTTQTVGIVVLLLLVLVGMTDGLPEREDCCLHAREQIGLGKRAAAKPLPDMARGQP